MQDYIITDADGEYFSDTDTIDDAQAIAKCCDGKAWQVVYGPNVDKEYLCYDVIAKLQDALFFSRLDKDSNRRSNNPHSSG